MRKPNIISLDKNLCSLAGCVLKHLSTDELELVRKKCEREIKQRQNLDVAMTFLMAIYMLEGEKQTKH